MPQASEFRETALSSFLDAFGSGLPAFPAPEHDWEDEAPEAVPGFVPLVLPLHASDEPVATPWQVASDGRLVAAQDPAGGERDEALG